MSTDVLRDALKEANEEGKELLAQKQVLDPPPQGVQSDDEYRVVLRDLQRRAHSEIQDVEDIGSAMNQFSAEISEARRKMNKDQKDLEDADMKEFITNVPYQSTCRALRAYDRDLKRAVNKIITALERLPKDTPPPAPPPPVVVHAPPPAPLETHECGRGLSLGRK